MDSEKPKYHVVHEPDRDRFAVQADGETAVLEYRRVPHQIVFTHTGVPQTLEGRGIGSLLARTGLDWARAEGLRVVARCPFVRAYIERHPEYADLTRR